VLNLARKPSAALPLVALFCVAALWLPARAADRTAPYALSGVQALDEVGPPLTIEDVTRGAAARDFRPVDSLPKTRQSITRWYRFTVPRTDNSRLVLRLEDAVSDADLYFRRSDGSYGLVRFGMRVPFAQRAFPAAWPVAEITPEMRQGSPLYLRALGPSTRLAVESEETYAQNRVSVEFDTLFFIGFIASIGLLSFFLFVYLHEPTFRLHALLMAVTIVYLFTENTLSWQYLWPAASIDFATADAVAFTAYLLAVMLFARSFLSLPVELPALDRAIWAAFLLNVLLTFVVGPLRPGSQVFNWLTPIANASPFLLIFFSAIVRLRQGFREARFFIIGFGSMLVIFIVAGTVNFFSDFPSHTGNQIGSLGLDLGFAIDSMFFQFALADRVLAANRGRDEAQRETLAAQTALLEAQHSSIETLEKHTESFSRFVPHEFLEQLGRADVVDVQLGDHIQREMAILFSDIRAFTALSETMTPQESFDFVNGLFAHVSPAVREHRGFVDKYIGDAVMALFPKAADDAIDAAVALQEAVRRFNESRAKVLQKPVSMGVGLHWGTLMLGTIGDRLRLETTVIADAVNVASRVESLTKVFGTQIVVSGELVSALPDPSKYSLRPLGSVHLRGVSREIGVVEICDADEPELLLHKMATLEVFAAGIRAYQGGDNEASQKFFGQIVEQNSKDLPAAYWQARAAAPGSQADSTREIRLI
jgi:class 3 adenylate cyclase